MTSTARVQVDRFRRIDAVEWQSIMAQPIPPRTAMDVRNEITSHHLIAAALVGSLRERWGRRRAYRRRHGMTRYFDASVRDAIRGLRYRRGLIADLNAEVTRIEEARS